MIVQCDHCNTRFKLDDAKVKPGGVKVRCSKCKEIFLVKRDEPVEEPAADSMLAGGVSASAPSSLQQQDVSSTPASEAPSGAEQASAGDFSSEGFAFPGEEPSSFDQSFTDQAPPSTETSAASMDFDEFSLSEESAAPKAEFAPSADEGPDFGEVAFDQQVPEEVSAAQQMAAGDFEFGETPFAEEPAVPHVGPAAESASDSIDFSEFDFSSEEPAYSPTPPEPEPSSTSDFDFAFAADEQSPAAGGMTPPLQEEDLSSGIAEESFSFGTGAEQAVPEPSLEGFPASFGEDSSLEQGAADKELQPAANDFSDAFGSPEESELTSPPAQDQLFSFESDVPEGGEPAGATKKAAEMEPLDFGDIDFGGPAEKSPPPKREGVSWEMPVAATAVAAGAAAVAAGALHAKGGVPAADEDLPPLSIASRRKGSSIVSIVLIAIVVLMVVAIAGLGFYVYQEGPVALKKVGLGFMADWFGMESKEAGAIAIRNTSASFVMNKEAGELFVITGEALNTYKKPRASIQVKVAVFGNKGEVLVQRTAYCGNPLTKEQLATLPVAKIEAAMNNQFGDSLANLGVEPGKSIPFVAVFKDLPKNAGEFGVEVVNSTVASK